MTNENITSDLGVTMEANQMQFELPGMGIEQETHIREELKKATRLP